MLLPDKRKCELAERQPLQDRRFLQPNSKKTPSMNGVFIAEYFANGSNQTSFETPLRHFLYQLAKDSQFINLSL